MQYLLGLRQLGHEVVYFEECGDESRVCDWQTQEVTSDLASPASYLAAALGPIGFGDRWIYRAGPNAVGLPLDEFLDICATTDLLIIRGSPLCLWREEYLWPPQKIFIDADPGFTQMDLCTEKSKYRATIAQCNRLFTVGQRLRARDCTVPSAGLTWLKTVSPVCLQSWPVCAQPADSFSTIMRWRSYREVVHEGRLYGNKDKEFTRFLELPRHTQQPLNIALTGGDPNLLRSHGWNVISGWEVCRTPAGYQEFIQSSRAEFGVAKHGYVATHGGWFSDRSVCFLASGRPVLAQDTGLSDWLPVGAGLLTFRFLTEAVAGITAINDDYAAHARAARTLAEQFFAAERVLPALLAAAMG
jgi:hypothetical protein